MKIFEKPLKITTSISIFLVLLFLLIVTIIIYYRIDNPSSLWGALFGSLIAGLIVAIIQYLIAWQDYSQTEKLKKLKLIEVLYNRDSRDKYQSYIKDSKRNIDVMGVTAIRFFNHFADTDTAASEGAKVLLNAMDRNVKVRVLLPLQKFLPDEAKWQDANRVRAQYDELKKKYPHNIEIRYFSHTATHSIFRIDDTCIIGPVFPELESKYTPALHVMTSSPMALNYLDYFESEWNQAVQEHA